jgi:imidazole glycerol-phosphate synthase subunit HisH
MTIAIVDVGMGNVGSVVNMLRKVGTDAVRTEEPSVLATAEAVVLPGVGAFDMGMARLRERGLVEVLGEVVDGGTPVLGICLGMQLLADGSDEGSATGLGWIPGWVRRIPAGPLPVPHMGWNTARALRPGSFFDVLDDDARFYFVHSYAFVPEDPGDTLAETEYGITFASAVRRGNVTGVQFHPEKSHRHGMALLRRFAEEVASCTAPA